MIKPWCRPGAPLIALAFLVSSSSLVAEIVLRPGEDSQPEPMAPVEVFSDADEDPASQSRVFLRSVTVPDGDPQQQRILVVDYSVADNESLGYEYAGVAFPFQSPQAMQPGQELRFVVRPSGPVSVRINARDSSRRNAFGPVHELMPGRWNTITARPADFSGIDISALENFALSVTDIGRGELQIAEAVLPIMPDSGSEAEASASTPGVLYDMNSPQVYFGSPVTISDRDESAESDSTLTYSVSTGPGPGGTDTTLLHAEFNVAANPELGYQYSGLAIPFPTPLSVREGGAISFSLHATESIPEFEVVVRDVSHRRASRSFRIPAGSEWQQLTIPVSGLNGVDMNQLESVAFVVQGEPLEGAFQLAGLRIPVAPESAQLTFLQKVHMQPKWYTSAAMAELVAGQLDKPVAVLLTDEESNASGIVSEIDDRPEWRTLLSTTANLMLTSASQEDAELVSRLNIADYPMLLILDEENREITRTASFTVDSALHLRAEIERYREGNH